MKCRRIRIANIGPVTEGEVELKKVVVFFGPNNTGKSIVSRLIHALRRLDSPQSLPQMLGHGGKKKISKGDLTQLYGEAVLLHSALERDDVVTHGRESGRLTISRGSGAPDISLDFGRSLAAHSVYTDNLDDPNYTSRAMTNSVYIPAGRTGTVQSFTEIIYLKLGLAEYALHVAMQGLKRSIAGGLQARAPKREEIMPPLGSLPPHIEQFHDLVARTIQGRPSRRFNGSFSRIFGGTIAKHATGKIKRAHPVYRDPRGHSVAVSSAGSGIVSSAPILAGLHYVEKGGTLIIEEPEVHVEPSTQLALIDEVVSVSLSKNVQLVLTTHSDYVVKKILALVAGKKIRPSDIGMYYFRRDGQSYTRIERIQVDPIGAADQEVFQKALDSLVEEFSV